MAKKEQKNDHDLELNAMAIIYAALKPLDSEAQGRVFDYVRNSFSLKDNPTFESARKQIVTIDHGAEEGGGGGPQREPGKGDSAAEEAVEGLEGVSPVAQKWMRRNSFSASQISSLFSLGVDEIDLIANSVPGKSKREKFHNVLLLQGIASYLGSGAPRIDDNKLRQAAGHYGADPERNLWNYIKGLAADVSGSSSSGFTLTARGLTSATELIRQ